jgi:hypothetical protein
MADSLTSVPSVSVVTAQPPCETEQEASVELIFPDGQDGFQINAGVEEYGGHSLIYAKHSMRFSFKSVYGPSKLRYDLFDGQGTDEFDQILLRSGSHDAVFYENGTKGVYIRNRWCNDRQLEAGHPAPLGRFVHVYLNGVYWGQYQLMERPNAAFMASYFGGGKGDYDALNKGVAVDGDDVAWSAMIGAVADYAALGQYMDVENYADYMLLQFYGGNDWDWKPNQNWMAARKREVGAGFVFFAWDSDMVLRREVTANVLTLGGPGNMWSAVAQHPEFLSHLVERAEAHFLDGGMFTADRVKSDLAALAGQIEKSIIAETARWGSVSEYTPTTWQGELLLVQKWVLERTEKVVGQLRDAGILPPVGSPGSE